MQKSSLEHKSESARDLFGKAVAQSTSQMNTEPLGPPSVESQSNVNSVQFLEIQKITHPQIKLVQQSDTNVLTGSEQLTTP